jgi:hypothetical protein
MRRILIVVITVLCVTAVVAQDNKPEPAKQQVRSDFSWARSPYRLEFVVKELDDSKVINTRSYSMMMQSSEERGRSFGEVKAGSRVPVVTTSKEGQPSTVYMDVGVNINAQLWIMPDSNLLLSANTEVSSLADAQTGPNPIVRQMHTNTTGEVTVGKSNQLAIVDDPISKHRFEIDVTPTKLR